MKRQKAATRMAVVLATASLLAQPLSSPATVVSDVANTMHNLSSSNPSATAAKATGETQICVFCHTPHAATPINAPLWNTAMSSATYTPYTSSSLSATTIYGQLAQPGGSSKLCLSCHDGTLALGAVNVINGQSNPGNTLTIAMQNTGPSGTIPQGAGATTGFTRDLGVDLTNDHPISLTYDSAVANANGELRIPDSSQRLPPGSGTVVNVAAPSHKPLLPLEATGPNNVGQIQCGTCHDPHIRDTSGVNIKFLRGNRFQNGTPTGGAFNATTDNMCVACHDKAGIAWAYSAHANPQVAQQTYVNAAASQRDFPNGLAVWQAACLNCHDPHTVQGARRLLREGTDSLATPKSGGNSAIEENCYQCHTDPTLTAVTPSTNMPNIRSDFLLPRHMPITSADQPAAGQEVHDIGTNNYDATTQRGKDLIESQDLLGYSSQQNRHAECSDCHNPHRVVKFQQFNGNGGNITGTPDASGTHNHNGPHTNIASGVLRGAWGVDPAGYASPAFGTKPTAYNMKRGDPGTSSDTTRTASYVTREYQICLKCHSDYGFGASPPPLGNSGGSTMPGVNGVNNYTNQAMEFQAPFTDQGETTEANSGAGSQYTTNNHRSWHPVFDVTARNAPLRTMSSTNMFMSPWDGTNIGAQTMYCSDCHGSDTGAGGTAVPIAGNSWGPHGSTNDFILKGSWTSTTGQNAGGICFKCHSYANYATSANAGNVAGAQSGFGNNTTDTNLHAYHALKMGKNLECMWCHTAVPHGWKNKGLLVNLNDVGPEAGLAPNTEVSIGSNTDQYTNGPYYANAKNKIITFATSGNWQASNCGSAGNTGGGNLTTGKAWMDAVCTNPP